jgi:hypothetical protein
VNFTGKFIPVSPNTEFYIMERVHTVSTIAADRGVTVRSVKNWLAAAKAGEHGELGEMINGRRHFSAAERDILLSYASDRVKAAPTGQTTPTAALTVVTGNHRQTIDNPNFGGSISLANLRGNAEIAAYADPVAAANAAAALMAAAAEAMDLDAAARLEVLQQTRTAAAALERQAADLQQRQIEYRVKSDLIGLIQNQETARLGELLGKASALTGND